MATLIFAISKTEKDRWQAPTLAAIETRGEDNSPARVGRMARQRARFDSPTDYEWQTNRPHFPFAFAATRQFGQPGKIFFPEKQHPLLRSALFFNPVLARQKARRTFASSKRKTVRSSRG
jgi:hypothetical protein